MIDLNTNMTIETISIDILKENKDNPRIIKDDKFNKLVKSIREFPEMLNIRPIVVDDNMIVLDYYNKRTNIFTKKCVSSPSVNINDIIKVLKICIPEIK